MLTHPVFGALLAPGSPVGTAIFYTASLAVTGGFLALNLALRFRVGACYAILFAAVLALIWIVEGGLAQWGLSATAQRTASLTLGQGTVAFGFFIAERAIDPARVMPRLRRALRVLAVAPLLLVVPAWRFPFSPVVWVANGLMVLMIACHLVPTLTWQRRPGRRLPHCRRQSCAVDQPGPLGDLSVAPAGTIGLAPFPERGLRRFTGPVSRNRFKLNARSMGVRTLHNIRMVAAMATVLAALLAPQVADAASQHWGDFKRDGCVGNGKRQYSSRLWDIQGDWDRACQRAPATIRGQKFSRPTRCRNLGLLGMWGEFDVRDASCNAKKAPPKRAAHWGAFKRDACVSEGKRQYSSRLWDIQGDWDRACQHAPATVKGQKFARPARCRNLGPLGMWGEFDVADNSCRPHWGKFKRDACVSEGKRQYSSRLWDIQGDWDRACQHAPATVNGQKFARPTRCRNLGPLGMWGEFDVADNSCRPHWGDFKRDACVADGVRQYSSRLWDIQGDWNAACQRTPATVAGHKFAKPTRCRNLGPGGMWGEFDIKDASCNPHWGEFKRDACLRRNVRQFSSRLWDIHGDWNAACQRTPATVFGHKFARPTRCRNLGPLGMWGEFDVPDNTCPYWGNEFGKAGLVRGKCIALYFRQYYARLWDVPQGESWEKACDEESRAADGHPPPNPFACVSKGPLGMWGEWMIPDKGCTADTLPQDARREAIAKQKLAEYANVIISKLGFAEQINSNPSIRASLQSGDRQQVANAVDLNAANAGENPDGGPLRTVTVGATAGVKAAVIGGAVEAGFAFDMMGKDWPRPYATAGYDWGLGGAAGGGVDVGFWVCKNSKIGGPGWGLQFGVDDLVLAAMKKAEFDKGPSFAVGLWFNYKNEFQGFTLTPGFGYGVDYAGLNYVATAVWDDEEINCDGSKK